MVIVVNVGTPPLKREEMELRCWALPSKWSMSAFINNVKQQLATLTPKDILIVPQLGIGAGDFNRNAEFIPLVKELHVTGGIAC